MIAFRGQKKVGPRPDWSPSGVSLKISVEHPRPFHMRVPSATRNRATHGNFVSLFKASVFWRCSRCHPRRPVAKATQFYRMRLVSETFYESSIQCKRNAYTSNLVVSQTLICKWVILLPLIGALFLIDEAPYVGVKSRPNLFSAKTGRSENYAFTLYTIRIQSCY